MDAQDLSAPVKVFDFMLGPQIDKLVRDAFMQYPLYPFIRRPTLVPIRLNVYLFVAAFVRVVTRDPSRRTDYDIAMSSLQMHSCTVNAVQKGIANQAGPFHVGEFALEMARWKESNHLEAACASFVVVTRVPVSGRQRASKKRLSRGCTNSLSRCYANRAPGAGGLEVGSGLFASK
ncbi:unnamed protein product [Symbiodinium sp. CCMP2592]|nr:unnamed protein product [Symbiodinium sp. CCMP2592]